MAARSLFADQTVFKLPGFFSGQIISHAFSHLFKADHSELAPPILLPTDPWSGDIGQGRRILSGSYSVYGAKAKLGRDYWFDPELYASPVMFKEIHSFVWLRDLRALGGEDARRCARELILSWLGEAKGGKDVFYPSVTGFRFYNLLVSYEMLCASASNEITQEIILSITQQSEFLEKCDVIDYAHYDSIGYAKGLIAAGLCLSGGELRFNKGLASLEKICTCQIQNGLHISRSPETHFRFLTHILDIRFLITKAGYPVPDWLNRVLDQGAPLLRAFRMGDKRLALFNGSQENDADILDHFFNLSRVRVRKIPGNMPKQGFTRMSHGKSLMLVDHIDGAFEWGFGKDRLVVNCGYHPTDPEWQEHLDVAAARSAFSFAGVHQIVSEIDKPMDENTQVLIDGTMLELERNIFRDLSSLKYERRIFLSETGRDVFGEDVIHSNEQFDDTLNATLRFHLHPKIQASVTQDHGTVLLKLPSGVGGYFSCSEGEMTVEASVYLGQGIQPRKNSQIAINLPFNSQMAVPRVIRWSFRLA